jgi:hypothetical protein
MYIHTAKTPHAHLYQVFVNDEPIFWCLEADEEGGWARCIETHGFPSPPDVPQRCLSTIYECDYVMPVEVVKSGKIEIRQRSDCNCLVK